MIQYAVTLYCFMGYILYKVRSISLSNPYQLNNEQWQNWQINHATIILTNLYIDGLVQERCNSIAKALELRLSGTNPSTYPTHTPQPDWYSSRPTALSTHLKTHSGSAWESNCFQYYFLLMWVTAIKYSRADSRFAPSQRETALHCNNVSHWLGTNLESALCSIFPEICIVFKPYGGLVLSILSIPFRSHQWHWCSHKIALVQAKQYRGLWVNRLRKSTKNSQHINIEKKYHFVSCNIMRNTVFVSQISMPVDLIHWGRVTHICQ